MTDEKSCSIICNCLYFTSNKLNRIINKMAEEEFIKTGLSPSQAFQLMTINKHPGISQKELGNEMNIKPSTTTRFIDKLESRGLVTRKAKGKISYLYPTEKGMDLQSDMEKSWKNLLDRYSKILGYEEGREITRNLYETANLLEKHLND